MQKPDHKRLLEVLDYDPDTGVFRWKRDVCNVSAGTVAGNLSGPYPTIQLDGYRTRAHRWAWFYVRGKWPANEIDHINGDKHDNRIANLRDVPRSTNAKNLSVNTRNTSGVMGVVWHKGSGRWKAEIKKDGKSNCLGYFRDWFDAVCARKSAENTLGFHTNHGRPA